MLSPLLSGPGLGLQVPQYLYPSELTNAPYDVSNNRTALSPGEALPIPAGTWIVGLGMYLVLQYRDPITSTWVTAADAAYAGGWQLVTSDGFNVRAANLLGCPLLATVEALGSAYVQASTTVAVTPGNSTWAPIVGGRLALSGGTLVSNGAGYGVAPLLFIPGPPPAANNSNGIGGIPASGYCTIASGTVSGITLTNAGAGYQTAPTPVILPNPTDPNIATGITQAVAAFTLTGAGALSGAFCTNPGAPLSNPNQITLTVSGAGASGSLSAQVLQTVTAASVSGGGTGYGTVSAVLSTVGGVPSPGSIAASPSSLGLAWRPRPAHIGLTITAAGTLGTQTGNIYDGGLFLTNAAPAYVVNGQAISGTGTLVAATIALTMGGRPDILVLQPFNN